LQWLHNCETAVKRVAIKHLGPLAPTQLQRMPSRSALSPALFGEFRQKQTIKSAAKRARALVCQDYGGFSHFVAVSVCSMFFFRISQRRRRRRRAPTATPIFLHVPFFCFWLSVSVLA